MRIALISLYGIENIGIRLISSVLKKEHFPVSTIYLKKWVNNNIHPPTPVEVHHLLGLIKDLNPSLIAISLGSPYFKIAKALTRQIKQEFDVPIVWGGIHATIAPERCIEGADIVCVGEGEYPIVELAQAISKGGGIDTIQNLWIKKDSQIKKNSLRNLIENLDELPFPDLDSESKYYIEDNKLIQGDPLSKSAEYRIIASRGCPFSCSYCYNSTLRRIYEGKGKYSRQRSVKSIIDELEYSLKKLPHVRKIKFDDDTFIFPKEWIDDFCNLYKRTIHLPFEILLNPAFIEESTLWKLKNAGLKGVQIGIQSGSKREVKEVYARIPANEQILQFAKSNKRLKLDVVYDIILDDPLATEEDKRALFAFLMELPRPFRLFLYSLTIFPKTAIAEKLLTMGLISEKDIEGEATKSFRQFRVSFGYPRSKEDTFYMSLFVLISKSFVPKKFIYWLHKRKFLRQYPYPLKIFSYLCNLIRISFIALIMLVRGELSSLKLKEYASLRLLLSQ
jgi:radical SAM superfamily enzyme YgiQ (UPF0313 family)